MDGALQVLAGFGPSLAASIVGAEFDLDWSTWLSAVPIGGQSLRFFPFLPS
jgi:hypothetical protein